MTSKTTLTESDTINDHSAADVEKRLREKLEASGEFGKMRAMIVDAALKALYNNEWKKSSNMNSHVNVKISSVGNNVGQETNVDNDHASSPFTPSRTLRDMKESEIGKIVFALIIDMLDYCHLPYTANVLRMEANLTKEIIDNNDQKEYCKVIMKNIDKADNENSEMPVLYSLVKSAYDVNNNNNNNKSTRQQSTELNNQHLTRNEKVIEEDEVDYKQEGQKDAEHHEMPQEVLSTKHVAEDELHVKSETTRISSPQAPDAVDSTYFISKWHDKTFTRINAITGQQLQVEYLSNCTLHILDAIDSMTIDDCDDCELIIAACEGSVFIRNCHRLTVHVACKQLRLRDCAECELHVFTSTDPVIEMSYHITFRPFHLRLPDLSAKFAEAHLIAENNRFVHVYDFTEDEASLPQPHCTIRYPDHDVQMENKCTEYGSVNCPKAVEQLLDGTILPAASSETGISKSYNIKTGASKWQHISSPTTDAGNVVVTNTSSPILPSNNMAHLNDADGLAKSSSKNENSKQYASLSNITTNSYELSDDDDDEKEKRDSKINKGIVKSEFDNNNNNKEPDDENKTNTDVSSSEDDKSETSNEYDESDDSEEKDDESEDDESASYSDTDEEHDSEEEEENEHAHSGKDDKHKDSKNIIDDGSAKGKSDGVKQRNMYHENEKNEIDSVESVSVASPLREVPSLHKTNTDTFFNGDFANSLSTIDKSGKPPVAMAGIHSSSKAIADSHQINTSTYAQKHNEVNHNKIINSNNDDEEYSSFDDDDDDDGDDEDDHYNVDEDDDVF